MRGQSLQVGDRVVWTLLASCGRCDDCRRDLAQACRTGTKYGHQSLGAGRELLGGLAEYCLLLPGTGTVRFPPEFTLAEAYSIGCAPATIAAGCEAASDLAGRRVLVIGAGMLGLTACAFAATRGAGEVWRSDPHPQRRARALQFGATQVFAPEDLATAVDERTVGLGVDVALEISGTNAGLENARNAVRLSPWNRSCAAISRSAARRLRFPTLDRRGRARLPCPREISLWWLGLRWAAALRCGRGLSARHGAQPRTRGRPA